MTEEEKYSILNDLSIQKTILENTFAQENLDEYDEELLEQYQEELDIYKRTIDYINKQADEIEKLKKEIKYIREYNAELVEANSSLDWDYDELKDNFEHYKLQSIPKDKIINFIEKHKDNFYDGTANGCDYIDYEVIKEFIEEEQE